jgi:hypothetical protein
MLCIRYNKDEVDIEGSANDLRSLSRTITTFLANEVLAELVVATDFNIDASPYASTANALRVLHRDGTNLFHVEGNELVLAGDRESLRDFAANLPFDAEDPPSGLAHHIHYDCLTFPVDAKSLNATLTLRRSSPQAALKP